MSRTAGRPYAITQGRLWNPELRRVRFSPLPSAVCDSAKPLIQSIMMESLLSTATYKSLPVGVVIKSLSRGLAIFRHSVQGA
jgi:hypothetical protein